MRLRLLFAQHFNYVEEVVTLRGVTAAFFRYKYVFYNNSTNSRALIG